jgi:hypothetical protein
MKVKIGKYPSCLMSSIYTRHMNKKYDNFLLEDQIKDYEDYVFEAIEDGVQSVYNIINWLWFDRRKQKVNIQIDKHDTWSMDHTLAHIIVPMLKQLKEHTHGAPYVYPEDVPTELRPTKQELLAYTKKGESDPKWFDRWDWVMDEMILAFEQKCRDGWESDYYEFSDDYAIGDQPSKWDKDGMDNHQSRMTNGFKLFGKYYENLWD